MGKKTALTLLLGTFRSITGAPCDEETGNGYTTKECDGTTTNVLGEGCSYKHIEKMNKNELLRKSGRYCRGDAKQGVITNTCGKLSGEKYRTGDCPERTIGKAGSFCKNEGTCKVSVINSRFDGGFCGYEFECQCEPGFWGPECENDACSGNPCLNSGTCALTGDKSSFTCSCEAGFYGDFCELDESVNGAEGNEKAVLTLNAETQKNLKMMRNVAGTPYDRYGYEPLAMLYNFDTGTAIYRDTLYERSMYPTFPMNWNGLGYENGENPRYNDGDKKLNIVLPDWYPADDEHGRASVDGGNAVRSCPVVYKGQFLLIGGASTRDIWRSWWPKVRRKNGEMSMVSTISNTGPNACKLVELPDYSMMNGEHKSYFQGGQPNDYNMFYSEYKDFGLEINGGGQFEGGGCGVFKLNYDEDKVLACFGAAHDLPCPKNGISTGKCPTINKSGFGRRDDRWNQNDRMDPDKNSNLKGAERWEKWHVDSWRKGSQKWGRGESCMVFDGTTWSRLKDGAGTEFEQNGLYNYRGYPFAMGPRINPELYEVDMTLNSGEGQWRQRARFPFVEYSDGLRHFYWSEYAAVSVPDGIIFMGGSFEESGESVGNSVYMYKDDKWYNDLGALRKPFRHGFAIRNPSNGDIALMGGTQTTFWHRRWSDGRVHIEKRANSILTAGAEVDGRPRFSTKTDVPDDIFLEKKDMRGADEIDVEEFSLKKHVRGDIEGPMWRLRRRPHQIWSVHLLVDDNFCVEN